MRRPLTELIAKKIIEIGQTCLKDPRCDLRSRRRGIRSAERLIVRMLPFAM